MSAMLDAFLSQHTINDEEANLRDAAIEKFKRDNYNKALSGFGQDKDLSKHTSFIIPTRNPNIEQKTESHPHFANYDHSLEMVRNRT